MTTLAPRWTCHHDRVREDRSEPVRLSAVVVTYKRQDLLTPCLNSVKSALRQIPGRTELLVVDNGSGGRATAFMREHHPDVPVVTIAENRGFARGLNAGLQRIRGEWALLLNDDATLEPDAAIRLLSLGESQPRIGSVAAQMRFAGASSGLINSAGMEVDRLGIAYDRLLGAPVEASESNPVEVFGASGGGAIFRRAMLDEVGGFDDTFEVYLEDLDVAWGARIHGWRSFYEPRAIVYHHHSATTRHGSPYKYFHVGKNRVRVLARNADRSLLLRYGLGMLVYDAGYVCFVALTEKTLAPARGRLAGLREWRRYRTDSRPRRPVDLAPIEGLRAAMRRRGVWASHSDTAAG
jgi:GT2 family glycosyltransferase